MTELTHEELTRLLDYDPETGVFTQKVGGKGHKVGRTRGCKHRNCNKITINRARYSSRRLAWFYIHGEKPRNNLFVKNGDQFDDRISNIGMLPDKPEILTHEYLKQCIDYNPETGEFKWKITHCNAVCGSNAFHVHVKGNNYTTLRTQILNKIYYTNRLIVFWMTGYLPSPNRVVFPIDNNALNLKWSNIKVGSYGDVFKKQRNSGALASKGVCFDKRKKSYVSRIRTNGKRIHLGYFKTESEAHAAYMKAARKYYGELANDGYNHAMYEMEYETVEKEPVADELAASMEQAVDIAERKLEPAVVHDVGF